MANYATLKAAIADVIKTNGTNAITGALLQSALLAMINSLGDGYQYVGFATPSTNPGTPDQKVFYLASTPGLYSNFNSFELKSGLYVLWFDTDWHTLLIYDSHFENLILTKTLPGYFRLSDEELNLAGFIDASGNIDTTYSDWKHSDFKKVTGGTKLYANGFNGGGVARFAFYTSNDAGSLITTLDGSTGNMVVLDVPENAQYFRASGYVGTAQHNNEIYYSNSDAAGSYILNKIAEESESAKKEADAIIKTLNFQDNVNYQTTLANSEFKYNGFIQTNGTVGSASGWLYTDFIRTNPGSVFKGLLAYAPSTAVIAFYSSNNVESFIGYAEINLDVETTVIAPTNTQYFRVSTNFSLEPNSYLEYSAVGYASKTIATLVSDVNELKQQAESGLLADFANKKVAIVGDSISNGQFSAKSWGTILNEDCGFASLQNVSVNGATLNDIYNNQLSLLGADLDVIFVAGGANDFLNEATQTIGEPFQVDASGNRTLTTDTTVCGTLNKICTYLRQHYPSALIILVAPLKVCLSATASGQVNSAYDKAKSGNFYFEDMIEAFKKISLIHSMPLFDACSDGILNSMVSEMAAIYYTHIWSGGIYDDWGRDLTHPTTEGHKVLAAYIKGQLVKYAKFVAL